MTRRTDEIQKLERALSEAHRGRSEPVLGAEWAGQIMREIRQGATGRGQDMWVAGVVWRAAAVAAVVAVVLTSSVLIDANRDTVELTALLSDDLEAGAPLNE